MEGKNLAKRIVDFRAKNNLSQSDFAKMCNISYVTLSNIENDIATPSALTQAKIERVLREKGEQ